MRRPAIVIILTSCLIIGLSANATPAYATAPLPTPVAPAARATNVHPNRGIVISPFLTDTKIQPSDTTRDVSVTVTNDTAKEESFTISSLDFGSLNDTGGIVFAGNDADKLTQKYGLASWLQIPNNRLTLLPGASSVVSAYIENQPSLGPGGHYAALVLAAETPNATSGGSVSVKQKISALIFATKVGGEVYDMKLGSVQHDGSRRNLPGRQVYPPKFWSSTGTCRVRSGRT